MPVLDPRLFPDLLVRKRGCVVLRAALLASDPLADLDEQGDR